MLSYGVSKLNQGVKVSGCIMLCSFQLLKAFEAQILNMRDLHCQPLKVGGPIVYA